MASSYKELIIWQKSFELTKFVYDITKKLPAEERFGLASQMQRSAVSVPSNIAEGQQRNNTKEYVHFLSIARGSVAELETQLLLVSSLYSINTNSECLLLNEIQRMLNKTISTLKSNY